MIECTICGFHNQDDQLNCANCLRRLGDSNKRSTLTVPVRPQYFDRAVEATNHDATPFTANKAVVIQMHSGMAPFNLDVGDRLTLGRKDFRSRHEIDVDLSPYGAYGKGVSRVHAALCCVEDTLTLMDLDSANGTFINGKRLEPGIGQVVRNGDVVTFGNLTATVRFEEITAGVA